MIRDLRNNVQFLCTARTIDNLIHVNSPVAAIWYVKN